MEKISSETLARDKILLQVALDCGLEDLPQQIAFAKLAMAIA